MSDPRLSTIGELLGGAPEHLVERSAAARAQAQGVALEEVLDAWSGGGGIATATATVTASPAVSPAPPAVAPAPEPEPVAVAPDPEPVIAEVAVAPVEIIEEEEEEAEPVEPAALGDRIRLGAGTGAAVGAVLGLLTLVAEAPLILGRISQTTISGGPAVEVTWTSVAATGAIWAAAGAIITLAARGAGRFRSPAYQTGTTTLGSVFSGGFVGLVLGFGLGGVVFATAEASLSGTKLVAIGPMMVIGMVAASALLGALTGGIAQAMAQPAALAGHEAEDAETVRRRLGDALLFPVTATVLILVIVVSFGSLLLRFSGFAPLIAILVSIGTLVFATLMASRPNLRVTRNEVLVAAAGVGVVLLMIALIAASMATDHGEEEAPADHAAVIGVLR
ncbi:MAG: hypothetical protein OXS29_07265 [bacterium]|nr:hypothetical protein [bacterium]MDE0289644.1 hypothetical protein [bacterium]MDE0437918.1 hypothetical protein [bacterium]